MPHHDPLEIIDRLGGLIQSDNRRQAVAHGLQGVHLEVLRYLSRCNRYSNTPAAVALYLGSTKGTVSQSIKLLEDKGLVTKFADNDDKRIVRLKLRREGARLLAQVAATSPLQAAIAELAPTRLAEFSDTAVEILRTAQRLNDHRSFGQCRTCRFFNREEASLYRCGVTGEPLSDSDTLKICVEHEPKKVSGLFSDK